LALHKFQADIPAEIVGKVPATLGAIRVDTQHAYLRPALEIGVMLATDRSAAYGEGTLQLPGFLWKSSDLFESAVRRLFRQASRRTGVRVVKRAESLLMRGNKVATRTTPDLQFIDGVDVQLVLDSKYKVLAGAPLASDCYQVIAAGRRLRVHTVGLIYPVVGYGLDVEVLTVPGDGLPRRLAVMRLGLSAFRSGEHVDRLRRDVRRWLSSELSPAQDRILATA
jgi:5-methylcytosine-specific restriction endonuclease McrBC regulatory subunit McrC